MLQQQAFKKLALSALLLLAVSNAFAFQRLPVPGQPVVDMSMEAGCADCLLAETAAGRVPAAVAALAEVSEAEEFKNTTIFYEDDLAPKSHAKGSEWAPVGVLTDNDAKRQVTATLVDECHIYTARHIVDTTTEVETRSKPGGKKFFFHVGGPKGDKPFETTVGATPVAWGDYEADNELTHKDWMLLRLDDCVGSKEKYGHIKMEAVKYSDLSDGGKLIKAGYPASRSMKTIWVDETCNAKSANSSGKIFTDCAALEGDSGAGLFIRKADGTLRLVATHLAGLDSEKVQPEYNQDIANVGFTVVKIATTLGRYLPYLNETKLAELPTKTQRR